MPLQFAPMQPVRFWTGDLSVKVNPSYAPKPDQVPIPHITMTVKLEEGVQPGGGPAFRCQLDVATTQSAANEPLPYAVEAQVIGLFAFIREAQIEAAAARNMVAHNGVALLYGMARDVVVQHTSMAVHGPLMLPAINLTEFAAQLLEGAPSAPAIEETAAPSTPPRRGRRRSTRPANEQPT